MTDAPEGIVEASGEMKDRQREERRNRAVGAYYALSGVVSVLVGVLLVLFGGLFGALIALVGVVLVYAGARRWRLADLNEQGRGE